MTTKTKRKNPAAVALGRKGGLARLTKMTKEQRVAVARLASAAAHGRPAPKPERLWVVLHPLEDNPPVILFCDPDERKVRDWARKKQPSGIVTFLNQDGPFLKNMPGAGFTREYESDAARQISGLKMLVEASQEKAK